VDSKGEQSKQACIGLITSGETGVANFEVESSEFDSECEGMRPVQREQTREISCARWSAQELSESLP